MGEKSNTEAEGTVRGCPNAACAISGGSRLQQQSMLIRSSPSPARRLLPARSTARRARQRLRRRARAGDSAPNRRPTQIDGWHSEPPVSSSAKSIHRRPAATAREVVYMDHFRHVFIGEATPGEKATHQTSGAGPSSSKYRHQWTKVQDKKLVDILLWNLHNGTIEANKIKDVVFRAIAQELSNLFAVTISPRNVRNRVMTLRNTYTMHLKIKSKTGIGWDVGESKFVGPEFARKAVIQQDSRFKRFRRPQHLSWDDLHELFGSNCATGHFAGGFEEPRQEWDEEGGATFTMETPQSEESATGLGGEFAIPGSSGTPIGGSSSHSRAPSDAGGPSPSSFEHRSRLSIHRRPQTLMQEFVAIAATYLGQPGTVSHTHTHTYKQDWADDYRALPALLESMRMTDADLTVAMCYFNKNPLVASAFVAASAHMRTIMLNGIRQGL